MIILRRQAAIRPAFTLGGVAGTPTPGDYTLEALDAAGRVIAAYPLALDRAIADPARWGTGFEKTGFHLSLPHIDGIASIRLRRGAAILGTLVAGPRAPLGFEEDLVDLAPPAEPVEGEEPDAGAFWKEFIRETAPEFRKPTIEQLDTFIRPVWASLIACEVDGRPAVGVVSAPALGTRWWAGRSLGATFTVQDAILSPFSAVTLKGLKVTTTGDAPLFSADEVRALGD